MRCGLFFSFVRICFGAIASSTTISVPMFLYKNQQTLFVTCTNIAYLLIFSFRCRKEWCAYKTHLYRAATAHCSYYWEWDRFWFVVSEPFLKRSIKTGEFLNKLLENISRSRKELCSVYCESVSAFCHHTCFVLQEYDAVREMDVV